MTGAKRFLTRAAQAKRSSRRIELKDEFDSQADGHLVEMVRDVAALANSGGGVVVLVGVREVDEELIHEQLATYAEPEFEAFAIERITRGNRPAIAIVVEGVKRLFNQYGVMLVNPEKYPSVKKELGQTFIDWLILPEGQAAIAGYKIDGQQLFFPDAEKKGA